MKIRAETIAILSLLDLLVAKVIIRLSWVLCACYTIRVCKLLLIILSTFVLAWFRACIALEMMMIICLIICLCSSTILVEWSRLSLLRGWFLLLRNRLFRIHLRKPSRFFVLSSTCYCGSLVYFKWWSSCVLLIQVVWYGGRGLDRFFFRTSYEGKYTSTAWELAFKTRVYYLANLELFTVLFYLAQRLKGWLFFYQSWFLLQLLLSLLTRLYHLWRPASQAKLGYIQLWQLFDLSIWVKGAYK